MNHVHINMSDRKNSNISSASSSPPSGSPAMLPRHASKKKRLADRFKEDERNDKNGRGDDQKANEVGEGLNGDALGVAALSILHQLKVKQGDLPAADQLSSPNAFHSRAEASDKVLSPFGINEADSTTQGQVEQEDGQKKCSTSEEMAKREQRLAMNRNSARERRKRKRDHIEELQRSVVELTRRNQELRERNEALKQEIGQTGPEEPRASATSVVSSTDSVSPSASPALTSTTISIPKNLKGDGEVIPPTAGASAQPPTSQESQSQETSAATAQQAEIFLRAALEQQKAQAAQALLAQQNVRAGTAAATTAATKTAPAQVSAAASMAPAPNATAPVGVGQAPNPFQPQMDGNAANLLLHRAQIEQEARRMALIQAAMASGGLDLPQMGAASRGGGMGGMEFLLAQAQAQAPKSASSLGSNSNSMVPPIQAGFPQREDALRAILMASQESQIPMHASPAPNQISQLQMSALLSQLEPGQAQVGLAGGQRAPDAQSQAMARIAQQQSLLQQMMGRKAGEDERGGRLLQMPRPSPG